MAMFASQSQVSFPTIARGVPEDNIGTIHGQNGQSSSLVIGRRSQWLEFNPTQHGGVRVLLRWDPSDRPGLLGTYYPWTLSIVDGFRPNRHICRIGVTYLARCLRLLNGHIRYAQAALHISHTHENDTRMSDEQQQVATQDRWDFYNVYPQVMSILGEVAVERHESHENETLPSECCQGYIDEQEDTYTGSESANDSGIDLDLIPPPRNEHRGALGSNSPSSTHENAAYMRSERVPHVRYRWSVDETIALHLLEAMESRRTDVQGRGKKKRIGHRLRQRIVTFFREIRTRYL